MLDDLRLIVQLAIGMLFLVSASSKVLHPSAFARSVTEYKLLPDSLAFAVGLLLIPIEIILGVSHLVGWRLSYMAPLALATLISFAFAVSVNLRRGRVLPCYCFGGQGGERISSRTLVRLGLLIAGELFVLADPKLSVAGRLTYPERTSDLAVLSTILICAVFVLVAGRWVLTIPDIIDLFRPCPSCRAQLRVGQKNRDRHKEAQNAQQS